MSTLLYTQFRPPSTGTTYSRTALMCDTWDPQAFALAPGDYLGHQNRLSSGGSAVYPWSWYLNGEYQRSTAALDNFTVQYSSGPHGPGAASACDTGDWYASPDAVPGARREADGTYTGVNRVRVTVSDRAAATGDQFVLATSIALRVRDVYAVGDPLANFAAIKYEEGVTSPESIIASNEPWVLSDYDGDANRGKYGDRLILGRANARLVKEVRNPVTGEFTATAVPQYTGGDTIAYRLTPTLTADVSAEATSVVIVEDCLPPHQQLVAARREGGEPFPPAVTATTTPPDAALTCAPGQTYLRWELGELRVGAPIEPIVYDARVGETVRNGTHINTARITASGDPSIDALRTDAAQIQVVVPTGIKIAKSTPQSVVEVNPADVARPRALTWTFDFANIDSPLEVSDVDVIDVLPADGLEGSRFRGRLELADVVTEPGMTTWYTARPAASLAIDPNDPRNGAGGDSVWCDAADAGRVVSGAGTTADCPSGLADVTGLRFLRSGAFTPDDTVAATITMIPLGNAGGDVYVNRVAGRADGVTLPVGPARSAIEIVASAIGDRVWEDRDGDGIQGADEPGMAGFPVELEGQDVDGNPVARSAVTDASGRYSFSGVASGRYRVTFDPEGLDERSSFTVQAATADETMDSDGDPATGRTAWFDLDPDSVDDTWDQGIVVDRSGGSAPDPSDRPDPAPDASGDLPVTGGDAGAVLIALAVALGLVVLGLGAVLRGGRRPTL